MTRPAGARDLGLARLVGFALGLAALAAGLTATGHDGGIVAILVFALLLYIVLEYREELR
jgi:hypothetical protein